MYQPPDGTHEFVELFNATAQPVLLFDPARPANTWQIDGLGFTFPGGVEVPGYGVALVVPIDPAVFRAAYDIAENVQLFGPYGGALDNVGETIRLLRPDEPTLEPEPTIPYVPVDTMTYRPDPWLIENGLSLNRVTAQLGGSYDESWIPAAPTPGDASELIVPQVVDRHLFYNNSAFDGNDAAANADDNAAVAIDKQALRPGHSATLANYTSFSRGINGIFVDVAFPGRTPTAAEFVFRVGNDTNPGAWSDGPPPVQVAVRPGKGTGGSDRVTVVWPDLAIRNGWLQVTVLADGLGLAGDDVFYFGNAVAESGNQPGNSMVTSTDLLLARNNPRNFLHPAAIDFAFDYNRDQRVNATDVLLARNNQTNFLTALRLIDVP